MSASVVGLVYRCRFGSLAAKAIAVKLADNANDDGENIFPSKHTVADACECAKRTVDRHMDLWLVLGILNIDEMGGGRRGDEQRRGAVRRRGRTSLYSYDLDLLARMAADEVSIDDLTAAARARGDIDDDGWARPEVVARIKGVDAAAKGAPGAPSDGEQTVHQVHPIVEGKGCTGYTKRVHRVHQEGAPGAPEPSLNHHLTTPPSPIAQARRGGSVLSDLKTKGEALCAAAEEAGAPHHVVAHLLRPVLTQRRFSSADRVADLVTLARRAADLPSPALERAAKMLLEAGVATIKPQRLADAIAMAKAGGAMVVVRRGSAQWHRWVEHFDAADPTQAALMRRFETWQVRAEWPPGVAGASRLAAGEPAGTRGPDAQAGGEVRP